MNTSYKSIWNESLGAWVAASEITKGRGKRSRSGAAIATALVVLAGLAGLSSQALAAGDFEAVGTPGAGAITVSPSGSSTNASANGSNAIAIGTGVTASAANGIAVGGKDDVAQGGAGSWEIDTTKPLTPTPTLIWVAKTAVAAGASAAGIRSIAVGAGAVASGISTIAQGDGAKANNTNAIAIGTTAAASSDGAIALGENTKATGSRSAAFGVAAAATGQDAIAMGFNANAGGGSAIAVGIHSKAVYGNDTAFGARATAMGDAPQAEVKNAAGVVITPATAGGLAPATAFGNLANANAPGATAFGTMSKAAGKTSTAIGYAAEASAENALAVGILANASGDRSTALGVGAKAAGAYSAAVGRLAAAAGSASVAIGGGDNVAEGGAGTYDPVTGLFVANTSANDGTTALGARAVAIGSGATAEGASAIAQGDGAKATKNNTIAIGTSAQALADAGVAVGLNAQSGATGQNVAIGTGAVANGATNKGGAVSIGRGNTAIGDGAVAIGDPSIAIGNGAFVGGRNSVANGDGQATNTQATNLADGAVAIGNTSIATGQGSVALGNQSKAGTAGSLALGDKATVAAGASQGIALGSGTKANNSGDVALGSGATTDAAHATLGTTIGGKEFKFAGTAPASVVSVGAAKNERQITNVAAGQLGSSSTDAVNGSQLFATNEALNALNGSAVQYDKSADGTLNKGSVTLGGTGADGKTPLTTPAKLSNVADGTAPNDAVNRGQLDTVSATANKGWNLSANGEATPQNIAPGGKVDFVNGSNTTVSRTGNQIKFDVSKTPSFESVATGTGAPNTASATLGANGLTTKGADGKAGPSMTTAGIDAGGKPITGVTAGTNSTDAANVAQVKAVEAKADNAVQYDAKDGKPGKDSITLGGLNADGAPATAPVKLANVADGKVEAGSNDAVNGGQLNTTNQNVTNLGNDIRNGAIGPVQAVPGKTDQLTLVAPGATGAAPGKAQVLGNVADGKAPTDAVNVGQLDALAGSAVQYDRNADGTPDKSGVTLGGKNADGTPVAAPVKVGNLADGNVAAGSKDAVNGGQLNAVSEVANKGWNLSANGEATPQQIAPGAIVDFVNGSNTTVSRSGNQIKVDVSKTPTFESVTATNGTPGAPGIASATLGANGLTTSGADGKAGPSVTTAGIDAGGKPVTNVGAGTNGTDAANVAQVKAVEAKAENAVQYDAKDGKPGKDSITLGGLNADGTPATAPVKLGNVADGNVAAGSKDAVNGSQLNTTNQNVTTLGDSIAAGTIGPVQTVPGKTDQLTLVAPGATGAAPGNAQVLGNVADGKAPTDAANVGQLDALAGSAVQYDKNADGTPGKSSVTLGGKNADGTAAAAPVKLGNVADGVAPNDAVNRGQLDTVSATANKGWNLSANAEASPLNIAPGGTVDFINGSNTTVSRTGNQIKVDVSKTPTFESMTATNGTPGAPGSTSATLGANGLTTTGTDGKSGPSVTTAGIDAGGKPITNVGAGTNGTDAANVAQVKAVEAKADNAVQYDKNADGTPGKSGVTLGGLNADGTPATAPVKLGNVADGVAPNEAVNRGQLDTVGATANKGWNLSANAEVSPLNIAPGGTVDFANGSNTTVSRTGNQIKVGVSKTPVFDSVTAGTGVAGTPGTGSATLGANGLTIVGTDGKAGPSVTTAGIDAGGKPITNVGAGTNGTDAANVAQVKAVEAKADNAVQYDAKDGKPGKDSITLGGLNADGTPATVQVKLGNVADGNVAAGSKDAVNGGQLNTTNQNVTKLGDNIAAGTIGPVQTVPGKTDQLTLVAPGATGAAPGNAQVLSNVAAGKAPTDAANVGQLDALAGSAVQYDKNADGTPGKSGVTLGGLNADDTPATVPVKLGNVADGNVAAGSKDAVNGGQLNAVGATANKGWNLSANGEATPQNIAPGGAVDFINGSNTTVTRTNNQIKVDVSKTPVFDSVTTGTGAAGTPGTGSATLGANGLTTVGTDGKAGPSVTTAGIDAAGKPITNVGAGTNGTDAANVDQVKAVEAKADNGVQYDAKDGKPGKDSITLGGLNADGTPATAPVKLANVADGKVEAGSKDAVNGGQLNTTNQNVTNLGNDIRNGAIGPVQAVPGKTGQLTLVAPGATASAPGNAQVLGNVAAGTNLTDAANVGQVKAVEAKADNAVQYDAKDGKPGKDSITLGGLNADGTPATAPVKLGNVADGNVAAGSRDAVNGGQLNTINTHTNTFLGGGADVASGKAPTYDVAGGSFNDVGSALGAVDQLAGKGWNLSANGEAAPQKVAPGGTVDFVNGSNTTVSRTGNQIKVDVSKTPTFESVMASTGAPNTASATLGADGLTTTGADGKAGPSVTTAGIDAGGKTVTNVGKGVNGTDAANMDQVSAVEAKADNAVQYDAKDGKPGKDSITLGGLNADGTPATAPVKLGNVAHGKVEAGSKDAINGGQLNALGTGVTSVLGGTYTNGVYTPPTFVTVGGGSATTVQGALDNLGTAVSSGAVGPVQRTGKDDQLALVAPGATGAAPGAAQQLTNVKAGELSSTSTDAVNGSQLHAVSEAVAAVGTKADNSVQYDKGADGMPGKSSITLGGVGADGKTPSTDPVKLGNVADGKLAEGSKDAVNGGQLFTTNQNVTNLGNDLKKLTTNVNDGKVGPLQRTDNANELVLVAKDGTAANPGAAQRVSNVANGTSAGDAVNFGQLQDVAKTANNSVQYDGADKGVVTMGGAASTNGGKTGGTRLANVAQGAVNDKSTDAVNGAQLNATHTAVSNYLGGGANLNEGKAPSYTVQGNTYDNVGGALGSVNQNLTTVNNAINGGGIKYFRANSTLPDANASGADAVAVGPQAVASGASSVAVGSGAQAASASGTAIGFKAVVKEVGGVALGAGSVASTAAGVAGYVPEGAGAQQAAAVRATKGTQGAVSVGDAANGQFRQITGVAAGTADSDAANVAQLKASASAVKAGSVQYDTNPDGTVNYGQITMGNGLAPDGTRISNVAPGVMGNDAVNVNQLNSATAASMNYTDARVNQLGNAMKDIEKKSYAGTAAAMALESAPYVPGKVTYAAGLGHYPGQTAVGASLRKTADSGRWSVSGGVTATSAGTVGVRAGISGVWD